MASQALCYVSEAAKSWKISLWEAQRMPGASSSADVLRPSLSLNEERDTLADLASLALDDDDDEELVRRADQSQRQRTARRTTMMGSFSQIGRRLSLGLGITRDIDPDDGPRSESIPSLSLPGGSRRKSSFIAPLNLSFGGGRKQSAMPLQQQSRQAGRQVMASQSLSSLDSTRESNSRVSTRESRASVAMSDRATGGNSMRGSRQSMMQGGPVLRPAHVINDSHRKPQVLGEVNRNSSAKISI